MRFVPEYCSLVLYTEIQKVCISNNNRKLSFDIVLN